MGKRTSILILVILAMALLIGGCGTDDIDISGYADSKIILTGLSTKDETVTLSDLKPLTASQRRPTAPATKSAR